MTIETWLKLGWDVVEKTLITTQELGYADEDWRLLGDGEKEQAIVNWWLDKYLTIGHEVLE